MCFPPALLSQSDIKEAVDRPQHGTREVGMMWVHAGAGGQTGHPRDNGIPSSQSDRSSPEQET